MQLPRVHREMVEFLNFQNEFAVLGRLGHQRCLFYIFMCKTNESFFKLHFKIWNWNVIRTRSHSNISMLCFSSSFPLSKCVAAVFCCIGLINPSWANTSPHTGNKRAILPTKWDKRLWNMKDMKIYKRSYSHELIKKTKKYKFLWF